MCKIVHLLPVLAVALAGVVTVLHDPVDTGLPGALLAHKLVSVATGAPAFTALLGSLLGGLATTAHVVAAILKLSLGITGDAGVDATPVAWAGLALVGRRLLAPLLSTDVGGPEPLIVNVAGIGGADREALIGTEEALLPTVTLHDSTLVALWGDLAPAGPWDATAIVSSPS